MMRLTAALGCVVVLLAGCSAEATRESIQREAEVVIRADLRSASTGEDAAELTEKYIKFPGVAGTEGDAGDTLTLFLSPKATEDEAEAVRDALSAEPRVEQVRVERRK